MALSFGQPRLAVAIDEMIACFTITEWLGRNPMTDGEVRAGEQEHTSFAARLLQQAGLRKACRQEAARHTPVRFFSAQCLNCGLVLMRRILSLT